MGQWGDELVQEMSFFLFTSLEDSPSVPAEMKRCICGCRAGAKVEGGK